VDWIVVAEGRDKWPEVVNAATDIRFPLNVGRYLTT
jgi:hypothetical protein